MISIKDLIKLTQKKYRREMGLCIIEGEKLVREHKVRAVAIFDTRGRSSVLSSTPLRPQDFDRVSSLETSQGVLAVVPIPKSDKITFPYLVLDGVQDPGNVGTLLRTACAFGFNTIFCINSADVWSQKVIRSAMGAQFSLNIYELSFNEFAAVYKEKLQNAELLIADSGGTETPIGSLRGTKQSSAIINTNNSLDVKTSPGLLRFARNDNSFGLVLGSEGQGISAEIKSLPHKTITIPMETGVESLNVAVAGGIIMYQLRKENQHVGS